MAGTKFDGGKSRLDLILPAFLWEMGLILGHGGTVHGDYNWQEVEPHRFKSAGLRHAMQGVEDKDLYDAETSRSHWAHVAVNAMFNWHFDTNREISEMGPCPCERCNPPPPYGYCSF